MIILGVIFVILVFIGIGVLIKGLVLGTTVLALTAKNRGKLVNAFKSGVSEQMEIERPKIEAAKAKRAARRKAIKDKFTKK